MDSSSSRHFNPKLENVDEFFERFELQNKAALRKGGDDTSVAAELLANALPTNVITDLQRRLKPRTLSSATYAEMRTELKSAYGNNKTFIGAAVAFINRKQRVDEDIETYAKTINELAFQCNYRDCCRDKMIRDIFLSGLRSHKLLTTFITDQNIENKSFQDCIKTAKLYEQATRDVTDISADDAAVSTNNIPGAVHKLHPSGHSNSKQGDTTKIIPSNYVCIRCGTRAKHLVNDCFAINLKCNKCSKTGHIARVCKTKPASSDNLNRVDHEHYRESYEEEDDDPAQYMMIKSTRPVGYNEIESEGKYSNSFL